MSFDMLDLPPGFNQTVSLFPLSSSVLFPGLVQVLHIFEPRYIQLTEDALRGDQLITRALIKSDSAVAQSTDAADAIHPMVCIGKVISHTRLEDGRFNLVLVGVCRARIVEGMEIEPTEKLYRQALVELPVGHSLTITSEPEIRKLVLAELTAALSGHSTHVQGMLKHLRDPNLPLGQMLDWIAHACGQTADQQQKVLDAVDLDSRVVFVREIIDSIANGGMQSGIPFPPKFSLN